VVAQGLSVRDTERLVHQLAHPRKAHAKRGARPADPDVARLAETLAETLGAKVAIEAKQDGSGRLVISYSSLDQLDGIIARLK
jgi:ParB family chromosome partitioning protein